MLNCIQKYLNAMFWSSKPNFIIHSHHVNEITKTTALRWVQFPNKSGCKQLIIHRLRPNPQFTINHTICVVCFRKSILLGTHFKVRLTGCNMYCSKSLYLYVFITTFRSFSEHRSNQISLKPTPLRGAYSNLVAKLKCINAFVCVALC